MDFFIKAINPKYLEILVKGQFIPMMIVSESVEDGVVVPQWLTPKDPSDFRNTEKKIVMLDISFQLIIIESLDNSMYNNVVNCKTAKHMWEKIEIIYEGTEEVRENHLEILTSSYEAFKFNP